MSKYKSDLVASWFFGGARLIFPVFLYLFAYGNMLTSNGPGLIGLWSLVSLVPFFVSTSDIGFITYFSREFSGDISPERRVLLGTQFLYVRRFFVAVSFLIALILPLVVYSWFLPDASVYSPHGFIFSIVLVCIGSGISLQNRMSEVRYFVSFNSRLIQFFQAIKQLFPVIFLNLGLVYSVPIEGFGVGFILSEVLYFIALRFAVADDSQILGSGLHPTVPDSLSGLLELLKSTYSLFLLSCAQLLRDPLLRLLVTSGFGLEAGGVYEISYRLAVTCFNFLGFGLTALPTNFSFLIRNFDVMAVNRYFKDVLGLVIGGGSLVYGIAIVLVNLQWFSGLIPPSGHGVVGISGLLMCWFWFNSLTSPVWYLLIAYGEERLIATLVFLHSLLSVPVLLLMRGSFVFGLSVWVVLGVIIYSLMVFRVPLQTRAFICNNFRAVEVFSVASFPLIFIFDRVFSFEFSIIFFISLILILLFPILLLIRSLRSLLV